MVNEKRGSNTDETECSIGKEVAILRLLLDMTTQQMADALYTSRVTLNKIEHSEDDYKITYDIGFRIYYMTQKILENPYKPAFIKDKARCLQQRIEYEVLYKKEKG